MMSEFKSQLPLSPAVFHILLVLMDGERHGYGIMQEIAALTGGAFTVGPGTLYRSIQQMLERGLIVEVSEGVDASLGDERRRYYRLTEQGQRSAEAEAARLAALVKAAQDKRLLPGSSS